MDTRCSPGVLSSRRIVELAFDDCVAALASWLRHERELQVGRGRLRGPVEHDRDTGTCRIEVLLPRGLLRRALHMRLHVDDWSRASSHTALELIPRERVRPTAGYFRACHLLLDSLTHALKLERELHGLESPQARSPRRSEKRTPPRPPSGARPPSR